MHRQNTIHINYRICKQKDDILSLNHILFFSHLYMYEFLIFKQNSKLTKYGNKIPSDGLIKDMTDGFIERAWKITPVKKNA